MLGVGKAVDVDTQRGGRAQVENVVGIGLADLGARADDAAAHHKAAEKLRHVQFAAGHAEDRCHARGVAGKVVAATVDCADQVDRIRRQATTSMMTVPTLPGSVPA